MKENLKNIGCISFSRDSLIESAFDMKPYQIRTTHPLMLKMHET